MKAKRLMITMSILLINIVGFITEASAYIAERHSKNSYKNLDYYFNIACFERVKKSTCPLPKSQPLNAERYQEKSHDFYELSQDIF